MAQFEKSEALPQWIVDIMSGPAFVAPEGMSLEEYYHAKGLATGYSEPPPVSPEQFAPGSEIPYWVYSKQNQQKIKEFQQKQREQAFPIIITAAGPDIEAEKAGEKPVIEVETAPGVKAEPETGMGGAIAIGLLALALAGGLG